MRQKTGENATALQLCVVKVLKNARDLIETDKAPGIL